MAKDNLPELPPREEDEFDFSVLWQEEEPATFTIPHIIELVFLFIILVVIIIKK